MSEIGRIKKHLERIYEGISSIKVSGDAVDVVADVRAELRSAFQLAERVEKMILTEGADADAAAADEV